MSELDDLYQQANIASQNAEKHEAIILFKKIIEKFPGTQEAYYAEANINKLAEKVKDPKQEKKKMIAKYINVWPLTPLILLVFLPPIGLALSLFGIYIFWSLLGFLLSFNSSIIKDNKSRQKAIIFNTIGLIFWICFAIYSWLSLSF